LQEVAQNICNINQLRHTFKAENIFVGFFLATGVKGCLKPPVLEPGPSDSQLDALTT